jgi:benzoyl-CoA reductase/2-hydroxyglutaryl-CoA dehydratase subunit BcrC/BadD/HgdB
MSEIMNELAELARTRPLRLKEQKAKGKKIIEFTGSFIPEQMIYAAGAEPYYLGRGGEPEPPDAVLPYMLRFMNPQARSQVGFHLLGLDPVTPITDLIVTQQTDCHVGRISELMEYLKLPVFKVGVPSDWERGIAQQYYYKALKKLKTKLEEATGNQISEDLLNAETAKVNKINDLLLKISMLRKADNPPLGGYDFIRLNHYSLLVEPDQVIERFEKLYAELKAKEGAFPKNAPRILLAGHIVAVGDYTPVRLIEESGGLIAMEMLDEGMRPYFWDVPINGDAIKGISDTLFINRTPPSIFQPAWKYRFERMKELIKENRIDGVIWYQLSFDEIYDLECSCILKWLGEMKVPALKLESSYEYSREATGPLMTRIESFVETLKERKQ